MNLFLNSYKIIAKGVATQAKSDITHVVFQTMEPLNKKWNDISERLII